MQALANNSAKHYYGDMEPATSIIKRLGGARVVADVTGVHLTRVYKWCKPRADGGTDGFIPNWHVQKLLAFAASNDVDLGAADFFPIPNKEGV